MEYRMYCLVLRHLSGINKGVQAAHVCMEYAHKYKSEAAFTQYVTTDKTLIMLDGGISQDLESIESLLTIENINFASFREPDINDCITSICFLVDERIFNREFNTIEGYGLSCETVKSPNNVNDEWCELIGGEKNLVLLDIIKNKKLAS